MAPEKVWRGTAGGDESREAASHDRLTLADDPAVGWLLYLVLLAGLSALLPATVFTPGHADFLFLIGAVGLWRYSLGITHFLRGMIFLHFVFPDARRRADALGPAGLPSKAYFLVTSFRIDSHTSAAVYRSVIAEARTCGCPATVVASIVELSDERLIRALWERLAPPGLRLQIVRIAGTGKRDGLAQAFRLIASELPDERAVVAVVDGDTVLQPGVVRRTAPFLSLYPTVGALTTNEHCRVQGGYWMSEWHKLRFAQRHLNMCSMALGRRVLTLTGRMSLFRASVVTRPEFIADIENDALEHWRLGRFRFLTGDDKSSWYSLMRLGYETYYVPDAGIDTLEHPPHPSFFTASRQLMFRWYGNSLRQNYRATGLGPGRLGWFPYYVLWDQRVSMWTGLLGISLAAAGSLQYGAAVAVAYALWIGVSRLILTLLLSATGHRIGPAFPLLLYYNQIAGSLVKIHAFFRLDQQSWTRQHTVLERDLDGYQLWFNRWSSRVMTFSASSLFAALILTLE